MVFILNWEFIVSIFSLQNGYHRHDGSKRKYIIKCRKYIVEMQTFWNISVKLNVLLKNPRHSVLKRYMGQYHKRGIAILLIFFN